MYPEMTENTLEQMVHNDSMPEKYLHNDGWVFNYEPVEHFLWLSVAFALVYYGFGVWLKPSKVKDGISNDSFSRNCGLCEVKDRLLTHVEQYEID